jgi:hypothetical protein
MFPYLPRRALGRTWGRKWLFSNAFTPCTRGSFFWPLFVRVAESLGCSSLRLSRPWTGRTWNKRLVRHSLFPHTTAFRDCDQPRVLGSLAQVATRVEITGLKSRAPPSQQPKRLKPLNNKNPHTLIQTLDSLAPQQIEYLNLLVEYLNLPFEYLNLPFEYLNLLDLCLNLGY